MSSQKPPSASSIALSTTSKTMWCSPVPSDVSPMYIPGRLRTASRPLRTRMLSESYGSPLLGGPFLLSSVIFSSTFLDPHRHDYVLEIALARHREQRARVGVPEPAFDF